MTYAECSPDAARSLAHDVTAAADRMYAIVDQVRRQVDVMTFSGPAADRLRDLTAGSGATVQGLAESLCGLSSHLLNVAAEVEEAQRQAQLTQGLGSPEQMA